VDHHVVAFGHRLHAADSHHCSYSMCVDPRDGSVEFVYGSYLLIATEQETRGSYKFCLQRRFTMWRCLKIFFFIILGRIWN
jgi:hypothetical protein